MMSKLSPGSGGHCAAGADYADQENTSYSPNSAPRLRNFTAVPACHVASGCVSLGSLARQHMPGHRKLLAAGRERDVAVDSRGHLSAAPLPTCEPPLSVHVGSLLGSMINFTSTSSVRVLNAHPGLDLHLHGSLASSVG